MRPLCYWNAYFGIPQFEETPKWTQKNTIWRSMFDFSRYDLMPTNNIPYSFISGGYLWEGFWILATCSFGEFAARNYGVYGGFLSHRWFPQSSSILVGFPILNHPAIGYPHKNGNPHLPKKWSYFPARTSQGRERCQQRWVCHGDISWGFSQ